MDNQDHPALCTEKSTGIDMKRANEKEGNFWWWKED